MNKIGFKFSWEQNKKPKSNKKESFTVTQSMLHVADLEMRINMIESFMMKSSFTRMNKKQKAETINTYRFLLTSLTLLNAPVTGMSEHTNMDTAGFME